jgi:hypothetical protein
VPTNGKGICLSASISSSLTAKATSRPATSRAGGGSGAGEGRGGAGGSGGDERGGQGSRGRGKRQGRTADEQWLWDISHPVPARMKQIPELGQCMRTRLCNMFYVETGEDPVRSSIRCRSLPSTKLLLQLSTTSCFSLRLLIL